ncbi:putative peroxisomal fatty acid beta-oxidation multifunctional protein AIM1-like [Capsicum annuum]|uniref:probable 2-oxoglutarate-dependent dioxygenase SLC1 n=1 Tax=Capsicum annuum TaxID=4072 RepID=UPI0007BEB431|nr:probable 2-oxoglutarate-dependent dioxygenase SLC1 [Capsicum annuum]KAF3679640.1 putative peroxisomal fatty acid beta-oxidation multifunctional protein AIM1-like [Capsicum annuum]
MSPALAKSVEDYHKGVKYLHESGIQRVPKKYIFPISERPNSSYTINGKPKMSLPIIDFSQLHGPNRVQVLDSLSYACENYGFFQLVNHGIPEEVIRSMVDVGGKFFDLPLVEREKYMTTDMTTPVRYGTSFNQTNDGVFCWRDFLKLVCEPLHDVLPHWPSSPSDFREMAIAYSKETKILFIKLVEAILESLGINVTTKNKTQQQNDDVEEILKEFEDGSQLMAINFYPPCPNPNLTLGMPPHSDYGFLTLLLQDEVEGLQVKFNGDWVTIQPIPGSFVVNVGDHLEIFSNGKYKSVLHRVLVNSLKSRISVASLHSLPFNSIIKPSPKLISEKNPILYRDTDFAAFLEYIKSCDSTNKSFLETRKLT